MHLSGIRIDLPPAVDRDSTRRRPVLRSFHLAGAQRGRLTVLAFDNHLLPGPVVPIDHLFARCASQRNNVDSAESI